MLLLSKVNPKGRRILFLFSVFEPDGSSSILNEAYPKENVHNEGAAARGKSKALSSLIVEQGRKREDKSDTPLKCREESKTNKDNTKEERQTHSLIHFLDSFGLKRKQ